MEYRRYGNRIVLRLDAGDEVCESVKAVAAAEQIRAGSVCGIGGADRLVLGVFDTGKQAYDRFEYTGTHEITSLVGNLTFVGGAPYVHLHLTAAGEGGRVAAGHLLEAHISLTAEIFIEIVDGEIGRVRNETLGINILAF